MGQFGVPASSQTIQRIVEELVADTKTGAQYENRHLALRRLVMELAEYSEYEIWSTYSGKTEDGQDDPTDRLNRKALEVFADYWIRALLNK